MLKEEILAGALCQGKFTAEAANFSTPEAELPATELKALGSVADLRAYAASSHEAAEKTLGAMSDDDLSRSVESPFGIFPAWRYFEFGYDEHWHHR
jgi:hypothetical protein